MGDNKRLKVILKLPKRAPNAEGTQTPTPSARSEARFQEATPSSPGYQVLPGSSARWIRAEDRVAKGSRGVITLTVRFGEMD
eukprot:1172251-Pyramimonas_sp.AAC.1